MPKTIDTLFKVIQTDEGEISHGVMNDYFGYKNLADPNDLQIIFNIYTDLIKRKCVSKTLVENCFFTNRLDELFRQKSKHQPSHAYVQFCEKNMTIGTTYIGESDVGPLDIKDDDCCPSCEASGYVTEHKRLTFMTPDCISCGTYMCKDCVNCTSEDGGLCPKCSKKS